jgi:hypothetical protein
METPDNPMNRAPRCRAHSKRSGLRCKAPAVRGWNVCRCHGAKGGAPKGPAHGMYRHGGRTLAADASRQLIRELLESARATLTFFAR